ncbi:FAD-dependent oxidoreductase, partial [Klebsiella pneumoniae]|nr:FAD-dependent oxidoreductase [Klebsiella pneumoniae]
VRTVAPGEVAEMYARHLRGKIAGVLPHAVRGAVCLYTTARDRGFLIDRHPDIAGVVIVSACSGHGFKHSAGIGERIAEGLVAQAETFGSA